MIYLWGRTGKRNVKKGYTILKKAIFYLGLGALFTHEMDAMLNHEWRLLPLTGWLPDPAGMITFQILHVPLAALLIAWVASQAASVRKRARLLISAFLVIHGGLHILFSSNPNYEFSGTMSKLLIYSASLLGGGYLVLEAMPAKRFPA